MKKATLALMLVLLILMAAVVAGLLLVDLAETEKAVGKLYTFPVSVANGTYVVTVRTNWTSEPKVYLPEFDSKYFSVDFMGSERVTVFFNVTFPADLIWGNISLVWKYYTLSADRYTLSNNGTHYSVYFTFNHTAFIEHFDVRGTEGAW